MKTTIYVAPNGRKYVIKSGSSLDYYVWVTFLDNPTEEKLIMHCSNAKTVK